MCMPSDSAIPGFGFSLFARFSRGGEVAGANLKC